MGLLDSLKRSRVRFADESDEDSESKTAFLKESGQSSKHGPVVVVTRLAYWTVCGFMVVSVLLLSVIAIQFRPETVPAQQWSQDVLGRGQPFPHKFSKGYNHSAGDSPEIRAIYSQYFVEEEYALPIHDREKYDLPLGYPSKKDKNVQTYLPSFIHQFHCLILFREAWWDLRTKYENKIYTRDGDDDDDAVPETGREKWDHVEHCMDYLRQTIRCSADTTLEAPAEHEDGQRSNTDGMNVWRRCYDMDAVFERYQQHKVEMEMVRPYKCPSGKSKHGKCLPVT